MRRGVHTRRMAGEPSTAGSAGRRAPRFVCLAAVGARSRRWGAGLGVILPALFAFWACSFDSAPLAGGPGLEPPGGGSSSDFGAGGTFAPGTTTGTTDPSIPSGSGGTGAAGAPSPTPDGQGSTPDASIDGGVAPDGSVPADAAIVPVDAAVTDAGGVATCRGWTAPGGACPAACTSCDVAAGVCNIDCSSFPGCSQTTIECPEDWACTVNCTGFAACSMGVLVCNGGPCEVTCGGFGGCTNWTIDCGADRCAVACTSGAGTGLVVTEGDSCRVERSGCGP